MFQSTRPRGARHPDADINIVESEFQSTRPRGARPAPPLPIDVPLRVSIHAPAWGATAQALIRARQRMVSIHAPAWGATHVRTGKFMLYQFQSTRPRGARLYSMTHYR